MNRNGTGSRRPSAQPPTGPRYPDVVVKLTGANGNALNVVGMTRRALDRHGVSDDVVESYVRQALSGNYDKVLSTTLEWVTVC